MFGQGTSNRQESYLTTLLLDTVSDNSVVIRHRV